MTKIVLLTSDQRASNQRRSPWWTTTLSLTFRFTCLITFCQNGSLTTQKKKKLDLKGTTINSYCITLSKGVGPWTVPTFSKRIVFARHATKQQTCLWNWIRVQVKWMMIELTLWLNAIDREREKESCLSAPNRRDDDKQWNELVTRVSGSRRNNEDVQLGWRVAVDWPRGVDSRATVGHKSAYTRSTHSRPPSL